MPEVRVGENEGLETALKRFKREIQREGILKEIKKREYYEKPSEKRKRNYRPPVKKNPNGCAESLLLLMRSKGKLGR